MPFASAATAFTDVVTAAVRGPGLELLGELAALSVDSWLDQPSLRISDAEQLAERVAAEKATIVVVESDPPDAARPQEPWAPAVLAHGPAIRLLPRLDDTNRFFWTSGADGRLRFLRCAACRRYLHPPSPAVPGAWRIK